MKNFLRLFVFVIFCVGTTQLEAQYKTGLTSGNFKFITSAGAGFINYKYEPQIYGFNIPFKPGSDESPHTIFNSYLTFGGFIDSLLHVHMGLHRIVPEYRLGPILANGNYPEEYESAFDTIWVVHRHEIQRFLKDFNDGQIDDAHPAIFGWPAKGNQILLNDSIILPDQDLAPFYDKNKNGKYEPMLGEYPSHDGDLSGKAIPTFISWSVYNSGPTYEMKLGNIEVQTIAYAYACENSTPLNNTAFFKMKVINRNPEPIQQFKIPLTIDSDIGCGYGNHFGTDTLLESLYFYTDTIHQNMFCLSEEQELPENLNITQSMTLLDHELDASNDYEVNLRLEGRPNQSLENVFYNLISGKTSDGLPIPFGWGSPLEDSTDTVTQLFTDRPSNPEGWSMRNSKLSRKDKRPYASIFVPEFASNEEIEINFATVASYDTSGQYDDYTIVDKLLDEDIPEAINAYENEFRNIECDYQELCDREECVWPGDSNNDERVFIDDYIQTGWLIKEQKKGNSRIYPTADWLPFHSENWSETYNGIEIKHADASGDGRIQVNDLQIIEDNFQKQTPLYQDEPWRGPQTSMVPLKIEDAVSDNQAPPPLRIIRMHITIGSELYPVEDLHSICFTIELEGNYIELLYKELGFLNNTYSGCYENPCLDELSSDQLHVAITELNDTSYSGDFTVAKFLIHLTEELRTSNPSGTIVSQMNFKNVRALRNDGTEIPLKVENGTLTIKNVEISTTTSPEATKSNIKIYPNPSTQDELYISGIENERTTTSFYNTNGSLISTKKITGNSIDISDLQAGLYFMQLQSDNVRYEIKRFVKLD